MLPVFFWYFVFIVLGTFVETVKNTTSTQTSKKLHFMKTTHPSLQKQKTNKITKNLREIKMTKMSIFKRIFFGF